MDLIDIVRTFHPNAEEYTFFSSAHGTFSRIDHILGHKSNLSKFKKIEIVSSKRTVHRKLLDTDERNRSNFAGDEKVFCFDCGGGTMRGCAYSGSETL